MCKKTPPAVVENNVSDEKVDDNKSAGNADLTGLSREVQIEKIFSNEKYIVLEESLFAEVAGLWYAVGFCVYEYDKNLELTEYKDSGNKLYSAGDGPYHFEGIYNDLLFIDEGTDVGIRGLHIFDLVNKKEILDAAYYGSFSFKDNIVRDLTMSSCEGYDDNIKTKFYELKQSTEVGENDYGLSSRFVVEYNFNVLTKEIYLIRGTYVYEQ